MKRLVILAVILSLTSVACNAFKDNYGDGTMPTDTGLNGSGNATGGIVGDISSDTTVCEVVAGVKVILAEESGVVKINTLSVAKDTEAVTSTAEKIGAYTTKITLLANDKEAINFVIKQTGEKEFAVCSVKYGELAVTSGEITIDTFNKADESAATKIVNAGAFKFVFPKEEVVPALAKAEEAVEVMGALASEGEEEAEATEEGNVVEGTYFVNTLTEAVVK